MYSVEQVAERLGLHVRTVRNYVRDGRLKAVRIGKQYRISADDLAAFTGVQPQVTGTRHVEVSAIVEVDGIGEQDAGRLAMMIMGGANTRGTGDRPLRIETAYDQSRARLKVIVLGDPADAAELLRWIAIFTERES